MGSEADDGAVAEGGKPSLPKLMASLDLDLLRMYLVILCIFSFSLLT